MTGILAMIFRSRKVIFMGVSCPSCQAENPAEFSECGSCGKALPSTPLTPFSGPAAVKLGKSIGRVATRWAADQLKRQARKASLALMAASIFQAIGATYIVIQMRDRGQEVPVHQYLFLYGISSMFFVLSLAARKAPFPAAFAGVILFASIQVLDAVLDSSRLTREIFFKGIIIGILMKAVIAGWRYHRISRKLGEFDRAGSPSPG